MEKNRVVSFSFTAFCLAYMMMSIIKLSPSVVMPVFQQKFSLTSAAVGLISSMYYLSYASMQLLTGPLCHKFGSFKVLCTGLSVSILGMLLFAFARNPVFLFVGRFLQGLGLGPVYVSLVFFLQENFSGRKYVQLTGVAVMSCSVGSAISGAPLHYLINSAGTSTAFVSIASFAFILVVISVFLSLSYSKQRIVNDIVSRQNIFFQIKDCFKEIFKVEAIRCGFFLWFFYNVTQITYQGLWSARWFTVSYPAFAHLAGYSSTICSLGLVVSCLISDFILNKNITKNQNLFRIGFAEFVCIAGLVIGKNLSFIGNDSISVILSFAFDFAFGFYTGHLCVQISGVIKEHTDVAKVATIMGVCNFSSGIVSQLVQWASGKMIDYCMPNRGYKFAFNWIFALLAIVFGFCVLYSRRLKHLA